MLNDLIGLGLAMIGGGALVVLRYELRGFAAKRASIKRQLRNL